MDQNLIAVIVGIVEGVTEFLPVSSTGHMIIIGHMLGFDGPEADLFDIVIQLGAILSIVFIYKERFIRFFTKDGWDASKGLSTWHIAAGIVPVMFVAFFAYKYIKAYLFSPFTVAIGLVVGALWMMFAEYKTKDCQQNLLADLDKLTLTQACKVGAFQMLSLWPGFSRSGSTIAGALLVGINREVAAAYSFLIAVPVMFGACTYDLYKNLHTINPELVQMLVIGFVTAFLVSYFSVLWFLKFLQKYSLTSFAYYRIILSVAALWYFYF